MRRVLMAVAALMVVGATAQAQVRLPDPHDNMDVFNSSCPNGVKGGDSKSAEGRTLIFDGTDVNGCVEKPQDGGVYVRPYVKFNSMIRVRANFTPELQKSVDQL